MEPAKIRQWTDCTVESCDE